MIKSGTLRLGRSLGLWVGGGVGVLGCLGGLKRNRQKSDEFWILEKHPPIDTTGVVNRKAEIPQKGRGSWIYSGAYIEIFVTILVDPKINGFWVLRGCIDKYQVSENQSRGQNRKLS